MPAGAVNLPILDGTSASRNVQTWSSTGAITGSLSPLQAILGADGLNISSAGNGFPVTIENASLAVTGTFFQATQPVSLASSAVASGAFVSGSISSGALAAGAIVDIGTGVSPAANTLNARLVTINTTLGTPLQAGGTVVANAGSGTFTVSGTVTANLGSGTNLAGKFGIDQTTPGTTNAVSLAQIGATTVLGGAGAVAAGAQRVAVGQDATTVAGMAPGTSAAGTAPTGGIPALGVFLTSPPTLSTGQSEALQLDNAGNLKVNIQSGGGSGGTSSSFGSAFPATGTAIGAKNGANMVNLTTDGSNNLNVAVANTNANGSALSANSAPVVIASDQAAIATKAASSAFATGSIVDLGTATTPAAGTANASLQTLAGAVTSSVLQDNIKQVNGVTVLTGTGAVGTGAQRIAVGTDTATIAGSAPGTAGTPSANVITVQGAVASGSSVTGAPLTQGGRAATANPTAVADGQAVNTMHDKLGKLVAVAAIRTLKKTQNTIITASTAETTIVTQTASVFNDLYGLILANTGATTTKVDIRDTTAGSIITTIEVPTLDTRGFMLPADSGLSQTTVNTNWTAQCGSSTSSLQVTALYVQNT